MADAAVAGALLSPLAKLLFEKMASGDLVDFIRGRKSTGRLLRKLEIELLSFSAVLEDAEDKQFTNPDVKKWLDDLKDAAYDAEDILDEIATEALRRQLDAEFQTTASKVRNLISTSLNPFVKEIETKIKKVLGRVEHLVNQKDVLRLKEDVGRNPSERLPTTCLVEDSGIFGRDDDKEAIINSLFSYDIKKNEMCVIAIVGMGGIGKTTLAQLVYNDNRVKEHFDLTAWVCVYEEFDVFKVTTTILEAVTLSTCNIRDLNGLQVTLNQKLTGKRFLLVLDDFWSQNYANWEVLSKPFKSGAPGSTVIVTTRDDDVASVMRASTTHHLKNLPEKDCWLLFAKHAFPDGNSNAHPQLEVLGRQIVVKCKGLPSAVKAIGALLWSELDVDEWDKVLESELWDLLIYETDILLALRSSYKYLPSHLKRCFAYCSIFPKGYVFKKDQLVLLWMAEGFLQQSKGKTMEEVGDAYFHTLVARSFFQQSGGSESCFVMHDLINDLAKFVSGHSSFRLEIDHSHEAINKTRHLSYFPTRFNVFKKFQSLYKAKQLRTFLQLNMLPEGNYLAKEVPQDLLPELSCLRVLSLSCYDNVTKLPESIGELKRVRYLNLSFTAVKRLPSSICKLYNLQTLKLLGCQYLSALPRDMWKLINLRHLDISQTGIKEMPMQLSKLKCLQTLTKYIVSKHSGSGIEELGKLVNLRGKLSILELQNVEFPKDALDASLKDKKYLKYLALEWNNSGFNNLESQNTLLDNLQSHTNLKSLTINYYGGKSFPKWIGHPSFSNIKTLHLYKCKYCSRLPPLGQLPSLEDLYIAGFDGIVTVGTEFYGSGSLSIKPFGALKVLRFDKMLNWEEWFCFGAENEGQDFPNLGELYIVDCPKLTGGLPINLPSLSRLRIDKCLQLEASLPRAPTLCELWLTYCNEVMLNELPIGIQKLVVSGFDALKSLPDRMVDSNNFLQELRICYCSSLMSLSRSGLPFTLKCLDITFCEKLDFPMHLNYPSLQRLLLTSSCDSLRCIQLELFPKLYEIKISGCRNLESFTTPEQYERDLVTLEIDIHNCPNFISFPKGGLRAPNLTSFCVINCGSLRSLPDKMHILLPSLEKLCVEDCPEVESFPEGGLPSNLNSISIKGCDKLVASQIGRGL